MTDLIAKLRKHAGIANKTGRPHCNLLHEAADRIAELECHLIELKMCNEVISAQNVSFAERGTELERQLADSHVKHEVACSTLEIVKVQRTAAQKALAAQCEEMKQLQRELAERDADARRYLQLRDHAAGQFEHPIVVSQHHEVGKGMRYMGPVIDRELDRLVDAAIKAQEGKEPAPERCHASRDGECVHQQCPQLRDGEPMKTGRHCPLDAMEDEEE